MLIKVTLWLCECISYTQHKTHTTRLQCIVVITMTLIYVCFMGMGDYLFYKLNKMGQWKQYKKSWDLFETERLFLTSLWRHTHLHHGSSGVFYILIFFYNCLFCVLPLFIDFVEWCLMSLSASCTEQIYKQFTFRHVLAYGCVLFQLTRGGCYNIVFFCIQCTCHQVSATFSCWDFTSTCHSLGE